MTTDISVGVRWDPIGNQDVIEDYEFEYDGGNSSSRLFERSRIKALAGMCFFFLGLYFNSMFCIQGVSYTFESGLALLICFKYAYLLQGVSVGQKASCPA